MLAAVKMEGTVFIFQICAVVIAFNCFPGNGEGRLWYSQQAKFIDCKSVFPRLPKASKHNLFGEFVKNYKLELE